MPNQSFGNIRQEFETNRLVYWFVFSISVRVSFIMFSWERKLIIKL